MVPPACSEWRQHDALIGMAIGMVRRHAVRIILLRTVLVFVLPVAYFVAILLLPSVFSLSSPVIFLLIYGVL